MPEIVRVYGHNASLAVGVDEDIWPLGSTYPWPQAALPLRIRAGGNAADAAAGAGAQQVLVVGLDTDFLPIQETIATAGAAQSAQTSQAFRRVNRVLVTVAGAYGAANTGAITLEDTSGNALGYVSAGAGLSHMAHYTVAANQRALFRGAEVAVPSGMGATLRLKVRYSADAIASPISPALIVTEFTDFLGTEMVQFPRAAAELGPKTDVWATGRATLSPSACSIEYQLELWRLS